MFKTTMNFIILTVSAASSMVLADPIDPVTSPLLRQEFRVDDHPAFIIVPTCQLPGPTPWVLYAPTLGKGLPGAAEHWMFRQVLDAGIAIAGVDVGESYGSPKGRSIYNALHLELTEKRGFTQKACLLARSRGGLMLYCWAAENPQKVKCIAGIYPVCNIASYPGIQRAFGAYGMTEAQLAADLLNHNPVDRLASLAKARVPIFHIHGNKDKVVPLDDNSAWLARRYRALGGTMTLQIADGQGHNMWRGFFECQPLVDFVIRNATAEDVAAGLAADPMSPGALERQFRQLPMEARRLTGPLFWMHGDANETKERLEKYVEKVAEGGNGCFTAESRPHSDWLGPRWYEDLDICLQKAKELDLEMWIFDERWWPSQSIGGRVPPRYAAKTLVDSAVDVTGPGLFEAEGYGGERYIATLAGSLNVDKEIEGESLLDLAPFIKDGKLKWNTPAGNWQVIKFSHKQAPGLGQRGGKELSVDGASRDCTDWFIQTVYQPHYDHFKDDFGKAIPGFFYDEPETRGDWGTELNVILEEWGVDWMKAYVAYKFKLAGDDHIAARYQYLEAIADAWGRVMYGGMTEWCHEHDVVSIGHFMEHGYLYLRPDYCAGDMMRLQKYSDMGGIDLVVRQMYPGQRPHSIYQTPKLCSSISHVYGKKDDLAMCEIFGGYDQVLTYPQMKWLTDQMQVRGVNFMIPHSFNPKAPHDRDYPPYFYNDGKEPRWPLYRVYADWTSRLSLMLTGGRHVCPVAILFSGNAKRVGEYVTPEDMTSALQDALYDCDWLPFEAFERDASLDGKNIELHQERYQVLIVPPTEVIPYATLAKARAFFDQGGVVIGYGFLPSKSGTVGQSSEEIVELSGAIWGDNVKVGTEACRTSAAGGRSYFLPQNPEAGDISAALHKDAGIPPVVEVLEGETDNWLHALRRVKNGRDVFFVTNQHHDGPTKRFTFRVDAKGTPECWDAMRNTICAIDHNRVDEDTVDFGLTLEPNESVLVVFQDKPRDLPRLAGSGEAPRGSITPRRVLPKVKTPDPTIEKSKLAGCSWVWHAADAQAAPPGKRYFRGTANAREDRRISTATFHLTADNDFVLYVNGGQVGKGPGGDLAWRSLQSINLSKHLKPGVNQVAIEAINLSSEPNPAGLIGQIVIKYVDAEAESMPIDKNWRSNDKPVEGWQTRGFDDSSWSSVQVVASYGQAPWGEFDRDRAMTAANTTADPYRGEFDLPAAWLDKGNRVLLECDRIEPEPAAAVKLNGHYVGGFIGKPFRLDLTEHLRPGRNLIRIEPFAPKNVQVNLLKTLRSGGDY